MTRLARFLLCLAFAPFALATAGDEGAVRLSEPVTVTDDYEEFGAPVVAAESAIPLGELVGAGEEYLGREITLTTRIAKVCRKKGCFFIARDGDAMARITFKDYGFFIPTDSAGKEVLLNGTFERREISAAQAEHYRKDLGDSAQAGPAAGPEYHIVATAVRIPRG
ncbi:DUF4920 domain-containing protein [Lentisalinibacter orientalis]|uniref:DUF4920 domain-containing protein n=1 Tax=Lentisalinibacter orientalis TaxID=2992241 RepID=UPI003870C630